MIRRRFAWVFRLGSHLIVGALVGFMVVGLAILNRPQETPDVLVVYGMMFGGGLGLIVGMARLVRPGALPGFLAGTAVGLLMGLISAVLVAIDYWGQAGDVSVVMVFLLALLWMGIPWGVGGAILGGIIGAVRGVYDAYPPDENPY